MVNYSFNVVDEDDNIRGVAMIDTEDASGLRLVPNVVTEANTSSVQLVESPNPISRELPRSPPPSPEAASTPIISSHSATAATSGKYPASDPSTRFAVPGSSKEPDGEFNVNNYIEHLEHKRNAEQKLSPEEFFRLSQPFSHGWERECRIGRKGLTTVFYISPSNKRCATNKHIQKCLEESPESGLTLDNFEFRKIFFGFSENQEKIVKSSFYTNIIEDQVGQKQAKWGKMVSINGKGKGIKCIYPSCNKGISKSLQTHYRHVLRCHTDDRTCPQCGKVFTATFIERHLNICELHGGKNHSNEKKNSQKRSEKRTIQDSELQNGNKASKNINKPKVNDSTLPPGWRRVVSHRRSGASAGNRDTYIFAPPCHGNKKFRSLQEVKRYFEETGEQHLDWQDFDLKCQHQMSMGMRAVDPPPQTQEIGKNSNEIKTIENRRDPNGNRGGDDINDNANTGQVLIKTEPRDHSENDQLNKEPEASLTFQTKQNDGNRTVRVKIQKLKTLNQKVRKLMRELEQEAGWDPSEAVWVCEGTSLSGEETAGSLDGKNIVLKKALKN